jgi:hypothetical protein
VAQGTRDLCPLLHPPPYSIHLFRPEKWAPTIDLLRRHYVAATRTDPSGQMAAVSALLQTGPERTGSEAALAARTCLSRFVSGYWRRHVSASLGAYPASVCFEIYPLCFISVFHSSTSPPFISFFSFVRSSAVLSPCHASPQLPSCARRPSCSNNTGLGGPTPTVGRPNLTKLSERFPSCSRQMRFTAGTFPPSSRRRYAP